MGVYFFWGDDDFQMQRAIAALRQETLTPEWASFNYDKISPDAADGPVQALNQAMTPPFGLGRRFVWLVNTPLGQRCPEPILREFERTLPHLPETTVLLLSSEGKPDGRAKFTKLIQKYGEVRPFATIPPWQEADLLAQVQRWAKERGVKLSPEAADLLREAVGNQTRQLDLELEKIALYWGDRPEPVPGTVVSQLVTVSTQNSLELAKVMAQGNTQRALGMVADLLQRNEPALRIVATLTGQFRLWLWVKVLVTEGDRDAQSMAQAAEIGNPKRVYILQKEVAPLPLPALRHSLTHLLALETALKRGQEETATLQTKVVEICHLFASAAAPTHPSPRLPGPQRGATGYGGRR